MAGSATRLLAGRRPRIAARRHGRGLRATGLLAMAAGIAWPAVWAGPAAAVGPADWPGYLGGPAHASYNGGDPAITPAGAKTLHKAWHFTGDPATMPGQPGPGYFASPTVADGAVFIGAQTGWFYKLDAATGAVLGRTFLGYQPKLTCAPLGVVATATVAVDPADNLDTVYVAAPDGYLYALSAADLSVKWKSVIAVPSTTQSDYFQWSSPTVANGKIYVGISSNCDTPLVRGGVAGYDQATGTPIGTFYTVPAGLTGGSVWSTVAVDSDGFVYATTGNGPPHSPQYLTESIVKLDPSTLAPIASFSVPPTAQTGDGDFGASPTIFGSYIGACDKNGIYYVLDRATMTLAWQDRIGAKSSGKTPAACLAAAAYDGTSLYMAGPATTVRGKAYRGSIIKIDPLTGTFGWQRGLPNGVVGSPGMSAGGVLTVGTFDRSATPNAEYLVNAATGKILRTLYSGHTDFAQGVFAGGWLYTANGSGVYGWSP